MGVDLPRPQRADARDNRERLVEAARTALAAGGELRLQQVAKAAGVGQGTLYRHFPTREHLLGEVYRHEIAELDGSVEPLLAEHPPAEALETWLHQLVGYVRIKHGVIAAIEAGVWQDLAAGQQHRLDDAVNRLLAAGRDAGTVRGDLDGADVMILVGYLAWVPPSEWESRAHRLMSVLMDGLRAAGAQRPIS